LYSPLFTIPKLQFTEIVGKINEIKRLLFVTHVLCFAKSTRQISKDMYLEKHSVINVHFKNVLIVLATADNRHTLSDIENFAGTQDSQSRNRNFQSRY
jgi:hypothetical protein